MAGHIAQALADHGDHVVGDLGVDGGVNGADELVLLRPPGQRQRPPVDAEQQGGGEPEQRAGQRGLPAQALDEADVLVAVAQGAHDGADLADRVVDGGQRGVQHPAHHVHLVGRPARRAQALARGGDLHAGGEQLLDRQVVQIAGDAGALVEQRGHLLGVLGVGQLEGHGRLPGDELGDLQVLVGEGGGALLAQQEDDADAAAPVQHRGVQGRPEARQRLHQQVGGPPGLVQGGHRQARLLVQGAQGPAPRGEEGADELGGVGAVGDLAGPGVPDAG